MSSPNWEIRPLTRRRKDDGALYTREKESQRQIEALANLPDGARRERILLSDRNSDQFICEETLVYFLREYARRGQSDFAWAIAERLTVRIVGRTQRELSRWRLSPDDEVDCVLDLQAELYEALFDFSSDAEFWEVRFWVCLNRRLWNLLRKRQGTLDGERKESEQGEVVDRSGGVDEGESVLSRIADKGLGPQEQAEMKEALSLLNEKELRAVFLRHAEGLPEESEDAARPTVAKAMGVTGRSVRNYLRSAEAKLRQYAMGEEIKPHAIGKAAKM
jgi:DNA-directed RNA polymerase specialized sigma24 family protein